MGKINCPHCKHEWNTGSKLVKVTCPSCNIKIPNKHKESYKGVKHHPDASKKK